MWKDFTRNCEKGNRINKNGVGWEESELKTGWENKDYPPPPKKKKKGGKQGCKITMGCGGGQNHTERSGKSKG